MKQFEKGGGNKKKIENLQENVFLCPANKNKKTKT